MLRVSLKCIDYLTKIKGNKVYFGKLVTFWGEEGGVNLPPTDPLDPLEGVSRGQPARKFSKGGVNPNFKSQGGSDPLGPPNGHLWSATSLSHKMALISKFIIKLFFL